MRKSGESASVYITYRYTHIKNFINPFYEHFLNRKPRVDELNKWADELESNNKTAADLANEIFSSSEFINKKTSDQEFITILYRALLRREPDKKGYEKWLNDLKQEESRKFILSEFINSHEFIGQCNKYSIKSGELSR